jgi:hypothetical protein
VLAGCAERVSSPVSAIPQISGKREASPACCFSTVNVRFFVLTLGDPRERSARIVFSQPHQPRRSATIRLAGNAPACQPNPFGDPGIMCQVAFSLAGEVAPYVVQLLDGNGHATATRIDPLNQPGQLSFILTNKYFNATVSFTNPLRGKSSRIFLDVLPQFATANGTAGIPLSPDRYMRPIHVIDEDESGATRLSSNVLTSSSDVVTLWYDGKSYVSPYIKVRPTISPLWTTYQRLIPILTTREFPVSNALPEGFDIGSSAMLSNGDGSYSFLASNAIDTVSSAGAVTSRPLPGVPVDLAKGPDGLTWVLISENGDSVLTRLNADGSSSGFPIGVNADPILLVGKDRHFWMVVGTSHGSYAVRIDQRGNTTRFRFGKSHEFLEPPASVGPGGTIWLGASVNSTSSTIAKIGPNGASTVYDVPVGTFPCCLPNYTNFAYDGGEWLYAAIDGFLTQISQDGKFRRFPKLLQMDPAGPFTFLTDGAIWYSGGQAAGSCNVVVGRVTTRGAIALMQIPAECSAQIGSPYVPEAYASGPGNVLWYLRGNVVGKVQL